MPRPGAPHLQPGFSAPEDVTAFADAFPVTVASLASLRELNDWIVERSLELGEAPAEPLPIERFRANLVIDRDTLTTAKEPIRALARHRLVDGKTMFAAHLVPIDGERVSVGDTVTAD